MKPPSPLHAPKQGTAETTITTAPENCTKNAHFSPAKAMAVSTPHRHKRAKATAVSDNRAAWSAEPDHSARGRRVGQSTAPVANIRYKRRQSASKTLIFSEKAVGLTTFVTTHIGAPQNPSTTSQTTLGSGEPGCGARGRWRGLAGQRVDAPSNISDPAPLVWRAPEGPEGQAAVPVGGGGAWPGFETTRRAKLAARTARGRAAAHGHTKQPGPNRPRVARNTRGATSNKHAYKNAHPEPGGRI